MIYTSTIQTYNILNTLENLEIAIERIVIELLKLSLGLIASHMQTYELE